jgi:STE24 endopeptidase
MTATSLLFVIIAILSLFFVFETYMEIVNASRFNHSIPKALSDVYDEEEYTQSQAYKKAKFNISLLQSVLNFCAIIILFVTGGFGYLDTYLRSILDGETWVSLAFFGFLIGASTLAQIPFSYYNTFVVEEQFGFNTMTRQTFVLDTLKSIFLSFALGGIILWGIIGLFYYFEDQFWWLAWLMLSLIMLVMNMFYTKLLVPLFNKQYPLEEGSLRFKIEAYATKVGFSLPTIKVIDGSKRSTKANAYFSGFGKQKQITLYDTLINDLEEDEIVAVLAHEVGHYKKRHIIYNLLVGIGTTGLMFYLLSLCLGLPVFAEVLGATQQSFHTSLLVFGILYSPVSNALSILTHILSRRFEYEADDYAKSTFEVNALVSSLKKLSKKSLSNLTPHPLYEWYYYSHPSLLKRVQNLKK